MKQTKKQRKGIEKKRTLPCTFEKLFTKDYRTQARTLPAYTGYFEDTGWTIKGEVCEDYYKWINHFEAEHPIHGWVEGNFETIVSASSEDAYYQFIKDHPYHEWDYYDL